MREDLTNTMVHDLRNPASVVLGALDLMGSEDIPDSQREIVDVAYQGAQRLLNLITAILDVNRLESGQMPLEREPVRMDIVAAEVAEMEQMLARDKRQTIENQVPPDLPFVSADVKLIHRVLQNLIGNAIKFTPPEGVIAIGARRDSADAQQVIVSVKDSGVGLTPELQARPVQQIRDGPGARTRQRPGVGVLPSRCRSARWAYLGGKHAGQWR